MMDEKSALVILIAAIFTGNILLNNFLGMCSFIACSGQIKTALGLGTAVTFVLTMTTMINFVIYHFVLIPLGIDHLTFIVFIAVIAAFVQFVEMFVERFSPKLYFALGIFLPLITVNCAILGASLFMIIRKYTFIQSVGYGFGAGVGWALAIVLMAGLRQKMRYSNIPTSFRGVPIAMLITGVLAMAFMGLTIADNQSSSADAQVGGSCAAGCHSDIVKGDFVHGPVGSGACMTCHELLDEEGHTWQLISDKDVLCDQCHPEQKSGNNIHKPLMDGDCIQCHDPHASDNKFLLPEETVAMLCQNCHQTTEGSKFLHGPVAVGECTVCHDSHSSNHGNLLTMESADLCYSCHETTENDLKELEFVHEPLKEGCIGCHDEHGADNTMLLKIKAPQLCYSCHEDIKEAQEQSKSHHRFVNQPDGCVKCHTPHASSVRYGLKAEPIKLCISCHDEPVATSEGKELESFSAEIAGKRFLHGPVSQKNCAGCHISHGSDSFRLLTKEYPSKFYASFSLGSYELCFSCHPDDMVLTQLTSELTDFRNGNLNLHYLHVNREEKGRTCRSCHATHASDLPKRICETVPYGKWDMPIQFEKTETGGSCKPGCHAPFEYDRELPVEYVPL